MPDLTLNYKDGRSKPLTLPDQFALRFLEFDGKKFERQKDGTYKETGEAPHTTLHGKSGGKATMKKSGGKR